MLANSISSEYQTIIHTETLEIYGYEAVAKFWLNGHSCNTQSILDTSMDTTHLKKLEIFIKLIQLQNRPFEVPLFINLNAVLLSNTHELAFWTKFFRSQEKVIVNIIDDIKEDNLLPQFIEVLENNNCSCSINNLFHNSTLISKGLMSASIIKIDKVFLLNIQKNISYIEFLKGIIAFCKKSHKMLILEGVESAEDLILAKNLGILYVQGFYFRD